MKRLCQRLNIPQYAAVGLLESLWHLAAKEAPQGDIGKLSNEDIALGLDWNGDADELVASLVQSRWLDEQDGARLVVHDWHIHCEDTIDVRLARNGLGYASGNLPRMSKLSEKERATLCAKFSWKLENGAFVRTKSHKKALPVPKPLPTPLPKPKPQPKALAQSEIERVYASYPRKVGKGEALKAIRKAIQHIAPDRDVGWLEARVKRFAEQSAFENPQFIPHPATWFKQQRYDDPEDADGNEINRHGKSQKSNQGNGDDAGGEDRSGLFEALYSTAH
jgi:hypothetical protein